MGDRLVRHPKVYVEPVLGLRNPQIVECRVCQSSMYDNQPFCAFCDGI